MAGSTKASGSMESNMEGESSKRKMFQEKESGKMVRGSSGSTKKRKTAMSKSPKNNKSLNSPSTIPHKSPSNLHILLPETFPFIDFLCAF